MSTASPPPHRSRPRHRGVSGQLTCRSRAASEVGNFGGNPTQNTSTIGRLATKNWPLVLLGTLAAVIFFWRWWRTYCVPEGDFTLHWIFGRRFLAGGFLYAAGMHTPYPPFWAMASSLLTIGPMARMRVILYPFGLVPLAAVLWILQRRLKPHWPLDRRQTTWALILAVLLSSRFLIRELPECGANLAMVALAWSGVYAWTQKRDGLGGLAIGLATALKCTSALFLVYFAWKRQWRLVAAGLAATCLFSAAPALWMGPAAYSQHMGFWIQTVHLGMSEPHPVRGVLGDDEPGNLALRPALGRLLVTLPPTHKGHIDSPWRIQPLDLPPEAAGTIIKGAMLLLLGRCRPRHNPSGPSARRYHHPLGSRRRLHPAPALLPHHLAAALRGRPARHDPDRLAASRPRPLGSLGAHGHGLLHLLRPDPGPRRDRPRLHPATG